MKKSYFKNSQKFAIRELCEILHENPIFFLGKLYQKLFDAFDRFLELNVFLFD